MGCIALKELITELERALAGMFVKGVYWSIYSSVAGCLYIDLERIVKYIRIFSRALWLLVQSIHRHLSS